MSDLEFEGDSSDSSIEDIEIRPVRPPSRSNPVPVRREKLTRSPVRSLSPNSVLNGGGDVLSAKICLESYPSSNAQAVEPFPSVLPLNVGGVKYVTRLSTLKKYPDSMLAALFSGRYQVDKDAEGNYFLDSNGILFGYLLEFLRNGLVPPKDHAIPLYREATYYGLHELAEKLHYMPPVVSLFVKEAHKSQFPNYEETKEGVIKECMESAKYTKLGEVTLFVFKKEFLPKTPTFNPNHGCIIETAKVTCGPWEGPDGVDEDIFVRCLINDLMDDGFNVKPIEPKRKCKYYHGQSCQKFVYKITILF
ncbi:BTB/POZ domain-containing protein KCTD7-like [Dreissena polymorpha]|uniref:Uncharacterized protein n=1 Tax=Dreissena polymorpha TaxID=45954 RepID=A0A9D4MZ84_DREPO|nr:BTB/POZ domain-containing protein KCTD7-like [Dreissena polymorpha]XP_052261184.1 BTB/POZ domain-containing protein KCTD7-like [Dreissena polymorpha]KAH3886702.1 hypothetical protein DPMN_010715 [Dreissena polymorpha]